MLQKQTTDTDTYYTKCRKLRRGWKEGKISWGQKEQTRGFSEIKGISFNRRFG